ncbi:hypothetical protein [Streptomyces sp. NPDC058964]|uniref:hypothetical protein n=1 Tax=Streptomyces sp. NPDC058964 TaxID=3346681 RepID=UPI00367A3BA3
MALRPVTQEPADRIIGPPELDLADRAVAGAGLLDPGRRTLDDVLEEPAYASAPGVPECDLVSPPGHFTYVDGHVSMPFSAPYHGCRATGWAHRTATSDA